MTWQTQWIDAQRRFLETLQPDLKSGDLGALFSQALDQWRGLLAPSATTAPQDPYTQLLEQGKAYFHFLDMIPPASGGNRDRAWSDQINAGIEAMKAVLSNQPDAQTTGDTAFWTRPLHQWQHTVATLTAAGLSGPDTGPRSLTPPTLGSTREHQLKLQALERLGSAYQVALNDYTQCQTSIALQALERMQRTLAAKGTHESASTPRALYNLWVDCCEDVYADTVATDGYAELHGRLVNSWIALQRQQRDINDDFLSIHGVPTRTEVDAIHTRLRQLEQEVLRLQDIHRPAARGKTRRATTSRAVSSRQRRRKQDQ